MKVDDVGKKIEETTESLMKKGVPPRAAAFASSMGYLRHVKKK
ncbi:hypothetical protein [Paraliobacillus ryukyuensis]|nr:hypothetical protein [Paraliobacillus ryukyuensis]